jgi:hypothetical protein
MRGTAPAIVYAISPSGVILRTLQIDAGDSGLQAFDLQASEDRLAILFRGWSGGNSRAVVKVVDLQGRPIAAYQSDDVPWGSLSCLTATSVTFFGSENGETDGPMLLKSIALR